MYNSGYTSPEAEVVALSPNTLTATNRFWCKVCDRGFQRQQNLQLHMRGHNLPWKLKQRTSQEVRKKVYICPELSCVHHDPSRALGDLTGIKKHFCRKHGEKTFICYKCDKKYAVDSDWKAHNKICGTKEYKCECGSAFSRRDRFIYHRSICDVHAGEVARHTKNRSPSSSMAATILANASNPGSISMGSTAASLIPGKVQPLSSPVLGLGASRPNSFTSLLLGQSVGSYFQPIQPPNMPLHLFSEPKLSFPRASDFSGIHGFPSNIAPSNMFNFGFNGSADLNSPQIDLDHNINNSFSGLMMNAELHGFPSNIAPSNMFNFGFNGGADLDSPQIDLDLNINNSFTDLMMNAELSDYNTLNSTPSPQFSATALLQSAPLTGATSNNVALMKSTGSSFPCRMTFNNYRVALGDGMTGGGRVGGSTFQEMYNNLNVGGESTWGYGGGMEYLSDQMNAPHGGMMYNRKNADGMLVPEVNNNAAVVEPQMNVQSEFCDKLTRDFLGMGDGMNSLTAVEIENDHIGNGMGTGLPDSQATTSAEARRFVGFLICLCFRRSKLVMKADA